MRSPLLLLTAVVDEARSFAGFRARVALVDDDFDAAVRGARRVAAGAAAHSAEEGAARSAVGGLDSGDVVRQCTDVTCVCVCVCGLITGQRWCVYSARAVTR